MVSTEFFMIVLVIIVVGVAIIIAVNLFDEQAAAANLDRVIEFLLELGTRAQKYYMTPTWMAGGGKTFMGLTANSQGISWLTNIPTNDYGTFSVSVAGNDTEVTLLGVGVEDGDDDGINCTATLRVLEDSLQLTIVSR